MQNLLMVFQKKKHMKRLSFITQFKIEFLLPFTDCRKVLGKMSAGEQNIFPSAENSLSKKGKVNCEFSHWSILGPFLFQLHIIYLPQALSLEIVTGNFLDKEFEAICKLFVDSKLPIHFGEDKRKCISFIMNESVCNFM